MAADWSEERRDYFDSLYMMGVSSEYLESIYGFTKDQIEVWGGDARLKRSCAEVEYEMTDNERKNMEIVFNFFGVDNVFDLVNLICASTKSRAAGFVGRELMKAPGIGIKKAVDLEYVLLMYNALPDGRP